MTVTTYTIQSMDEIIHSDEYIRDFEKLTPDYLHPYAESMALSVFREFTTDMNCSVYLDRKVTKDEQRDYELIFDIVENDNQCSVCYRGYD